MMSFQTPPKSSLFCLFTALFLSITVLSFTPAGAGKIEDEALPTTWQQIAESLAENETRYRVTGAIISGLDEMIRRDEQARIMAYVGLLEEFQRKAENEPQKFEMDRDLGETLDLLDRFRQDHRSPESSNYDFEMGSEPDISEREYAESRLENLSQGEFSEDTDLAGLYLDLKEQKYRENLEILSGLTAGEDEEHARVFFELAESLTIYLDDDQNDDEIQDEDTAELFASILQEEIRDEMDPEQLKDTIIDLLDTSGDYAGSGSDLHDEIENLRDKIR